MAATTLGTPTSNAGNSTAPSTSNTVGSGSNVVAYLFFYVEQPITAVGTFGGVTPQLVHNQDSIYYIYRVISPAAGATTASATLGSAANWSVHVHVVQDADTADPDDAVDYQTNTELEAISSTISSATGDLVIAFAFFVAVDIAAADGATLSTEEELIAEATRSSAVVYEAGATSVTLGATCTESFGDNVILAFNITAAAAGGTVNSSTLSDTLVIADAALDYVFANRLATDTIVITEGTTETFTVSNLSALSEVTVSDDFFLWLRRNRLLSDSLLVTDELISSVIGYAIYQSILTSNISVTDQALDTVYFQRLLDSNIVTTDQALRVILVARNLLDGIEVTDQILTAAQRFVLLTDTLLIEDLASALYVPDTGPVVDNPVIRIGFDQPVFSLGGYGLN